MPVESGLKSKQNFREVVLCPINQVKPEIFIAASFCSQITVVLARGWDFPLPGMLLPWKAGIEDPQPCFFLSGSL